jgi:hypothetical protein
MNTEVGAEMQSAASQSEKPERGVHELPYTKDGCVVLVALDARGDERRRVKLLPGVSYERAKSWLEQLLDRVDPLPQLPTLALVRDMPVKRRERKLHPAHANDYAAYRRRLIRQLAGRVHYFRD